jgi:putative ABC transport system permease protein
MSSGTLLAHHAVTLYRSLVRHRLYAALNVLGLAVGIAVFLVLWRDVRFETSFDRWIPDAANIYRVDQTSSFPGRAKEEDTQISGRVAPLLETDYPQVVAATRLVRSDKRVERGAVLDTEAVWFVDPEFFQVLRLPLVRGEAPTVLAAAGDLVISERIARKYFGTTDVLGRRLSMGQPGKTPDFRITGILRDAPTNTHLKLDLITPISPAFLAGYPYPDAWGTRVGPTYVRFRSAADARGVEADLQRFVARRAAGPDDGATLGLDPTRQIRLHLTPLADAHFRDAVASDAFEPGADPRIVASLGVLGVLTLAIAVLNYVNLATARAVVRAKEVAIRKTLGATRRALIRQFLTESLVMTILAALAGLALAELALPAVNAAGGSALKVAYRGAESIVPVLAVVTLLVALAAGLYPALVLSGYRPARVLASSRMAGGGRFGARVRGGLVLLQFVAAIAFTIGALVVGAQARHLQAADRGFRPSGLILVDSMATDDVASRQGAILDALRATPGVGAVTVSTQEPATDAVFTNKARRPGRQDIELQFQAIGPDYWSTYGAQVIAGRALDSRHGLDDLAGVTREARIARGWNTMINVAAVRALGFASPADAIGKPLVLTQSKGTATIVGVVGDVRFLSSRQPVNPTRYTYYSRDVPVGIAAVRYDGVATDEMMRRLRAAWVRVAPGQPFAARTADQRLGDYYLPDQRRARLFAIGAVLAVAIACVGLHGLASFDTARRVREIGIRKTLGASTADVLSLLVGQFVRPVLLANLIAWPLAWLAMRSWLAGFDQRIGLGPGYFLGATALTLAIAVATVAGQAFTVARAEPAKALRHE